MNFGEKLTKLRKQKGLSQEELGYELNVTRQTISKWELGQTTPEMDKLVEMSKVFGVTVDELTSEGEIANSEPQKIEDRPINDKPKNNSTWKVVLLIVAIFIIGGVLVYGLIFSSLLNFGKDAVDEVNKKSKEVMDYIIEKNEELNEDREEMLNKRRRNN